MNNKSWHIVALLFSFLLSSCFIKPSGNFNEYKPYAKPDYSNENNWAALPNKKDKAHMVPANSGLKECEDTAWVDVFFVHPTTYYSRHSWNADVNDERLNAFTDKTTIMHQASVFNGSCKIYAPRYRQATLYSFMDKKDNGIKALELAYGDVKEAFDYYLKHYNHGRPFIIASHSQGSRHATRLLHDFIENDTALFHRMIAAYIIGFKIKQTDLTVIEPCHSATETNCLITWNTILKGKDSEFFRSFACTNPLSWTTDTAYVGHERNMGGIPSSFDHVDKHVCDAQVVNGLLAINRPNFDGYPRVYGNSYHLMEYNLFYLNMRQNIRDRIAAYFRQR
ncbi:MAG: DUF3089 domain-containing protein [Bacteroidota bacterium]